MVGMYSLGSGSSVGFGGFDPFQLFALDPFATPQGGAQPFGNAFGNGNAFGDSYDPRTTALSPELQRFMQSSQQAMMQALAQELVQLLIEYVLTNMQQQQSRDAGTMGGGQNWGRSSPTSWGNGGSRGTSSSSGSGSPTASGPVNLPGNMPTGKGTAGEFLKNALAQNGDRYVYGAETNLDDPNPNTFDCSELVQWAAARAGVNIPDGSGNQAAWCRQHGKALSVEEAIRTPGALLFKEGHVAISLGDGRTIEAMGSAYGVRIGNARGRFTSGGLIPGMTY